MLATLASSVGYVQGGFAPRSAVSGAAQTARSAAVMQSPFMPPPEETRDAKGDAITSALSSSHTICTPTKRCAHWPNTRLTAPDRPRSDRRPTAVRPRSDRGQTAV